jgi:3-mercaptopyruvate sulfurtransferase SseA
MQLNRTIIMTLATVIAALGALWFTNGAVTPKETTWDDVLAEAQKGNYRIITTQELASAYSKNPSEFFLADTRQEWEYRTGHIKGAISFPMEPTWWSRWRKADALKELLGPDPDRKIVFY